MVWLERHGSALYFVLSSLLILVALTVNGIEGFSLMLLVPGVVLLGLPHGAMDTVIAPRALGHWRFYSQTRFTILYLLIAILYALLWWVWPTTTLASFLILSAWHFGSDWEAKASSWACAGYGLAVVCLPAVWHRAEVAQVFTALGAPESGFLLDVMGGVGPVAGAATILRGVMGGRSWRKELAESVMTVASALALPPFCTLLCISVFFIAHGIYGPQPGRRVLVVGQGYFGWWGRRWRSAQWAEPQCGFFGRKEAARREL